MSKIEKIRAEIERLYGEYKDKFHRSGDSYHLGLIDGLDMAERVLDTFSEESATIGYDEAYLNEKIAKASKTWEGVNVDKYMDEVRGREPDKSLEEEIRRYLREECSSDDEPATSETARHFAEWADRHKGIEWSEEDERKLNRIYEILGYAADDKGFLTSKRIIGDKEAIELQDFLKSLSPSWKPSEEQMKALEECGECKRCIKELYEQLSKRIRHD